MLTDFFSVDTVFLKRLYVLLSMELATRRLVWFAVTDQPDGGWVAQQARNVSWELNELGVQARFLVHDHDARYGGGSDLVFKAEGIEVITTPIAAPKANSHMERQIGSTRRECLDWILILNRRHLERVRSRRDVVSKTLFSATDNRLWLRGLVHTYQASSVARGRSPEPR